MSDREFEWVKVTSRGHAGILSGYRITCGKCGASETFNQTGASRKPPIAAEQTFRRKGWGIGASARADRCPACWGRKDEKPAKYMPFYEKHPVNEEQVVTKAETPAEPTREERRIIFAKLQDVYLDEKKGYDSGWTDYRVSEDLGVPRAWVASIRDENFGPAKDNAELRDFLTRVSAVEAEVEKFTKLFNQAKGVADVMKVQLGDLQRLAKSVRSQVAP